MKTLLLYNVYSDELGSSRPPLGSGYLSQALIDADIEHSVLDMNFGCSEKEVIDKVGSEGFDCVGISVYTIGHKKFFNLLAMIKKAFPSVTTIVGGPHVTIMGKTILEKYSHIDAAIIGEGENSFVQFLKGESPSIIPGLIYRENGSIVCPAPSVWIENLDNVAWPRYEKFELEKYSGEMGIISSRGCPYPCIFCSVGLTLGKKVRIRSVESIGDELEYWYKKGKRIFNFLDDNLTFYKERVFKICDEIEKRNLKGLTLRASNGLRADRLDRELLARMKAVGFKSFGIGVEAGNNKVLKTLRKGESIEQIEEAIKLACDMGLEVSLFFVYGAPGETIEDIQDSMNIAKKYPVFKADFYNLIPFPGTELWEWVEAHNAWTGEPLEMLNSMTKNLRFSRKTGKPFFTTLELNEKERIKISKDLRKLTLQIQRRGIDRLFARFGILKYPLSYIASTMLFQRLFFNNNLLRKLSEKIRFAESKSQA